MLQNGPQPMPPTPQPERSLGAEAPGQPMGTGVGPLSSLSAGMGRWGPARLADLGHARG